MSTKISMDCSTGEVHVVEMTGAEQSGHESLLAAARQYLDAEAVETADLSARRKQLVTDRRALEQASSWAEAKAPLLRTLELLFRLARAN